MFIESIRSSLNTQKLISRYFADNRKQLLKDFNETIMNAVIFVISLVHFVIHNAHAVRWLQAINLDPNIRLLWALGPTSKDITFELQVRTMGFIEFGFLRESNQIAGADIVVGWLNSQQVYFQVSHFVSKKKNKNKHTKYTFKYQPV